MHKLLLLALLAAPGLASAQHDYRNLDHGRPISTEDAYPVEQGALEVMFPWSHEREAGESGLMFEPEFMWGIFRNAMVGMGAPILLGDEGGLAGLRPFVFYNFNTEGRFPAFALRLDGSAPVGALGGEEVGVNLTVIVSRSFGGTRVHANGSVLLAGENRGPLEDAPSYSSWSLGIDHTLWRQSMVVMADVQRNEECCDQASWWVVGAGVRMQATPTMVFDIGMQRRLSPVGPLLASPSPLHSVVKSSEPSSRPARPCRDREVEGPAVRGVGLALGLRAQHRPARCHHVSARRFQLDLPGAPQRGG